MCWPIVKHHQVSILFYVMSVGLRMHVAFGDYVVSLLS